MITGIFTPNLVPFLDDGRINEGELRRMVNWLVEKGVQRPLSERQHGRVHPVEL